MFIFAKIKCSAGEGGGGLHGNAAMPRTHYLLRLNSITGMKKKRAEWKVKLRRSNFKMHRGELAPRVILAQTYKLNGVLERIVKGGCALSYGTLKHAADLLMNEIEDCLLEGSAVNLPIGILTPGVKGLWQVSERYDPKVRAQNEAVINYKMSAEDYVAHVTATYKALSDSIAADTFPQMLKEILQLGLKEEAVNAMMQGDYFREHNYRVSHNDWDFKTPVKGIDKLKPEQQAAVAQLFDINDPMLLMGWQASDYIGAVAYADNAWLKATGISEGFIPSLRKFVSLARKAQAAELTDADLQAFTPEESFYAEALKSMQQAALDKLKAAEGKAVIEQTPDVPVAKLFDAIVAPYKGKVVFVDFWNTWCGPCRASIKATEPLKSTELKHDDLVWIYIANESSPIVQYKTMIPDIQGKHYRLNDKQWAYLCDKFKIDGIPSYVVVDKDGTYKLRNDLRDHSKLVPTLQEKLAE